MFDFLIVGGGPAGAVTGYSLSRAGAKVAILEATTYAEARFGETLPPEINPLLRTLGLWEPFQALAPTCSPGIVSTWGTGVPAEQDFVANPHGDGWRIDRNAFDAMLLDAARRAGAVTVTGHKAAPQRSNGGWRAGGFSAGFLIDATGRNGLALDDQGARDVDDVLLAVTLRVSCQSEDCRTLIETVPGGWWYSGLLPEGNVMAMFFTDPETYNDEGIVVSERLAEAHLTRERLRGGRIESGRVVYAPSSCRKAIAGDGWLATGDAASAYDPLSGRGIFKAVRHGAAAADACRGGEAAIAAYANTVRREFDDYVRQRRVYYAGERRWRDSGFWARRDMLV